ncbi:uncharacterized protein UJ101_02018 [Flavobacteriaceae bacterium UJ101]|nr:uncharacterized protein UJ101_02018 [Flavobacteriaceae bacterium UJ101]
MKLSSIIHYPLKSSKGISLKKSYVQFTGLINDRHFMLATKKGHMMTAREHPKILNIKVTIINEKITFNNLENQCLEINYAEFSMEQLKTNVFDDKFLAYKTLERADKWFSNILGIDCSLLYLSTDSKRIGEKSKTKVTFADEYPILLISQGSLDQLNQKSLIQHKMAQFRPNFVVSNTSPFIEDSWKKIKIGDVLFEVSAPCPRCILTTINNKTLTFNTLKEPLHTLSKFRSDNNGNIHFGQYLIPLNEGSINLNDPIEVLETQKPPIYEDLTEELLELELTKKLKISRDFYSYNFKLKNKDSLPKYKAGQYLPLLLNVNESIVSRMYTLSSSPTQKNNLAITVKKVQQGLVSNWLANNLKTGDTIFAEPPKGHFVIKNKSKKIVLISAGSGITPMISFIREMTDTSSIKNNVTLYHYCENEEDTSYYDELIKLDKLNSKLHIEFILNKPNNDWRGKTGLVSFEHLKSINEIIQSDIYICGPIPFMDRVKSILSDLGCSKENLYHENFSANLLKEKDIKEITININESKNITGSNQDSVLNQLENNGINISNKCRVGSCGKCKIKLTSGEVNTINSEALTKEEVDQGYILGCVSIPKENIKVEI